MTEIQAQPVPLSSRTPDRVVQWRVQLDNYDPPREFAAGVADWYDARDDHPRTPTIVLRNAGDLKAALRAVYLIDTGSSVTAWYTAGWNAQQTDIYLQPFPLSVGTRPDNGRPVDMSGWALGPRLSYHLKVTE